MSFISKETPSGTINGINTEFVLTYNVYQIDDIWIDGAIYEDYTVSGKTITLADAPTLSILVDYYDTPSISTNFISKEVPSGNINGINTDFTLAYTPSKIDDVWLDGAIYDDFTQLGSVITLDDAPTATLFVDYWASPVGTFLISEFKSIWSAYESVQTQVSNTLVYYYLTEIDRVIYQKAVAINPEKFLTESTITLVDGTRQYSLPDDFWHIKAKNTGLYDVNSDYTIAKTYPITSYGSRTDGFYLNQPYLIKTPEPSAADTLTFRYIPRRTNYSADTDALLLPNTYQKFYVDWFSYLFFARDEDYQTAGVRRDFAKEAQNIVLQEFRKTDNIVEIKSQTDLLT